MRLDALLTDADLAGAGVPVRQLVGHLDAADVQSITLESREVTPGALYCCVPGRRFDGHQFAAEAVGSGAVALLSQRPLDLPVPQVVVESVRPAIGPLADALYGHPSRSLTVVGVTGTNGKTTTTQLLGSVFDAAGWRSATVGTLSGKRTTPEAPPLHSMLAAFRREGLAAVAMEVSSHALMQHRIDGIRFAAATFTNLSQDHLDYHPSMEEYFEAKARLFAPGRAEVAVVNSDDRWGRRLLERLTATNDNTAGQATVLSFSLHDVEGLELGVTGSRFQWHGVDVRLHLGGRFNVSNALAAATTAHALGIGDRDIADGLAAVESVRGRFEQVDVGQPFTVLVDFAHTPDGLKQALGAARELTEGSLLVVFGAGGDRDRAKRPLMGAVASRLADLVVLTSDNPRREDPESIIDQIKAGADGPGRLVVEPDRARAIGTALAAARAGDVVVIAGKGHESVQEFAGRAVAFDDAEVARAALARILRSRGEP